MKSDCGPERWCKITVVLIPSPRCRTGPFVSCEFKAKMKTSYYAVISVRRLYCASLRQYNELRKLMFRSFPLAARRGHRRRGGATGAAGTRRGAAARLPVASVSGHEMLVPSGTGCARTQAVATDAKRVFLTGCVEEEGAGLDQLTR